MTNLFQAGAYLCKRDSGELFFVEGIEFSSASDLATVTLQGAYGEQRVTAKTVKLPNVQFNFYRWELAGFRVVEPREILEIARIAPEPLCPQCASTDTSSFQPSHKGSSACESGSLASGGNRSHCSCDICF